MSRNTINLNDASAAARVSLVWQYKKMLQRALQMGCSEDALERIRQVIHAAQHGSTVRIIRRWPRAPRKQSTGRPDWLDWKRRDERRRRVNHPIESPTRLWG